MEKMKILTIAATPFFSDRGCHIRVYNEAKYLQKAGNTVRICTYHIGKDIEGMDVCRIGNSPWYKKTSPGFAWGKIWLDTKLLFLCLREIKKFNPDAIHAHLYEGLLVGFLANKILGRRIPIVLDLQGDIGDELESYNKKKKLTNKLIVWLASKVVNRADFVVVSGENALDCVEKTFLKKENIVVVKDGVDAKLFSNASEPSADVLSETQKIKELARDKKILVYAGGLSDSKGVGRLLDEFLRQEQTLGSWLLLLYGEGSEREKYQKMAQSAKNIFFTQATDYLSLSHFLTLADLAIDPKKDSTESSGKLAVYMAAGLGVVCFDSEFNKNRLGDKGIYLRQMNELAGILQKDFPRRIEYDLSQMDQAKEARKLEKIFQNLIQKRI